MKFKFFIGIITTVINKLVIFSVTIPPVIWVDTLKKILHRVFCGS